MIVLATLALAHLLVRQLHIPGAAAARVHQGLLGWDAGWYERISRHGYAPLPREALRFFPLVPLITRTIAVTTTASHAVALLLTANLSALAAAALLHRLVLHETGDDQLASRATWLFTLAPPAFVLVMGYADATAIALAVATFLAMRSGHWRTAAVCAFLAALARPVGVVLAIPLLIEAWSSSRSLSAQLLRRSVAAGAAVAGLAVELIWVGVRFGHPFLPFTIQQQARLRGATTDPVTSLTRAAQGAAGGVHLGTALHVPVALALVALSVITLRRWPLSYGAYAAASVALLLTARNLDSLERYGLSIFPLLLTLGVLVRRPWMERSAITVAAVGMSIYTLLALVGLYIP